MQKQSRHTDESVHQTVTSPIKLKTGSKTTEISFTARPVTGYGGLSALAGYFQWQKLLEAIAKHLPFQPSSPNATPLTEIVISYILGMLAGAKSLSQLSYLRRDAALAELFSLSRFPSQSTFTRFFQRFSQADNQRFFTHLWNWSLSSVASRTEGYTLDFDSTHFSHDDNFTAEGLKTAYTPEGFARSYHPLIAVLAEARLAAGFWLRSGDTRSDNNIIGFTEQVLSQLPKHVRVKLVRADSGFLDHKWLQTLEEKELSYIVVARLHKPLKQLAQATKKWTKTQLAGVEIADELYQGCEWESARRIVLIRHEINERPDAGGKMLFEDKIYRYQVLVTNLPLSTDGLSVWRTYNGRAGMENVIKELDENFAMPKTSLKSFWATEAALSLSVLSYNLSVMFQNFFHWKEPVRADTLRYRLFCTGGIVSKSARKKTLRLSVPAGKIRDWWRELFAKLSSELINCHAVEEIFT